MANAQSGNVIWIDTATNQVSVKRNVKVAHIIFTTSAAGDTLELRESASGTPKIHLKHNIANDSLIVNLSIENALFAEGVYVQTLSAGSTAMLVTKGP